MIQLEHVWKRYDDLEAVRDLNLQIKEGELCTFLGPSGCGKSTTLRMINKLILPSEGRIFVQGKNVDEYPIEKLRHNMGYVVQSTGLFPHMTVRENISVTPKLLKWDKKKTHQRADELLEMVGLNVDQYARKYPSELSGGEAQRVGVARALAANPPILLMDEPFGAVDPLNRLRLQNEFLKIQKELKKTVVFVTHDIEEAIKMGDKIAIMDKGVLQDFDTPQGLIMRSQNPFIRTFLGKEYALKILSKYDCSMLMQQRTQTGYACNVSMKKNENAMVALSQMIEHNTEILPIVEDGNICGEITIARILNALRADSRVGGDES